MSARNYNTIKIIYFERKLLVPHKLSVVRDHPESFQ